MPLSRVPRSPDLERVVQVLGGRVDDGAWRGGPGGWVPSPPGNDAPDATDTPSRSGLDDLGGVGREEPDGTDDDLEDQLRRARRPSLVTVPASLRSGRVSVTSSAVVAVLALVVALGCAFVLRILWAERAAQGETLAEVSDARGPSEVSTGGLATPEVVSRSAPAQSAAAGLAEATGAAPGPGAGGTGAGAAPQPELVVHVVGQVAEPGLVRLRSGSRVADAIEAAGGAKRGADLAALNLARALVDGEQVFVPKPGELPPVAPGAAAPGIGSGGVGAGPGGAGAATVNLNTADLATLETLPGVGPVLAQRIIDWRTEHGRFTAVEELGEVSGIGDKMLSQLRAKVTV